MQVAVSGYYAWRKRPPSVRTQQNVALTEQIKAVYEDSAQTYGSPRIYYELKAQGIPCSEKRIARLMRLSELYAVTAKRFVVTTDRIMRCRLPRTSSTGSSRCKRPMRAGRRISRISTPAKAGCTWRSFSICSRAVSWALRAARLCRVASCRPCAPRWSVGWCETPSKWPLRHVSRLPDCCATVTGAVSMPAGTIRKPCRKPERCAA